MRGRWKQQPFYDYQTKKHLITLELDDMPSIYESTKDKDLDIKIEVHREKRSTAANRLLWECISQIAKALHTDKWEIYLRELKHHGKFTYICAKPQAVEAFKKMWRECEEVGEININGEKSVQLLCYFGSSTYNTKEFSDLLEGVISDMKVMGLQPPTERDFEEAIKAWEGNIKA